MGTSYLDEARLRRTIAAVATAPGPGAIGIVRLSGRDAVEIASAVFSRPEKLKSAPSHTMVPGAVCGSDGSTADQVLAAVMRAPMTYTGENIVEFNCHGGTVTVESLLEACLAQGALAALPGEFTFRAFLHGKMDLTQAESVADLIEAETVTAARSALARLNGALGARLHELRERLIALRARCEATIDFVDDDIPSVEVPVIIRELEEVQARISELLETYATGRQLQSGARVAFTGRPNAGKSSLFNAILKCDRAIVSERPGTTRDTVTERVEISGIPVVLADTAGMRESSDPVESEGVRRSGLQAEAADLVVEVVDLSAGDYAPPKNTGSRRLTVLNKSDIAPREVLERARRFNGSTCVVSALRGDGIDGLVSTIGKLLGRDASDGSDVVLTRSRHVQGLTSCSASVGQALALAKCSEPLELVALELRGACSALDELVGAVYDEDIINRIFGEFCVGK